MLDHKAVKIGFDRWPVNKPASLLVARLAHENTFESAIRNPAITNASLDSGALLHVRHADKFRFAIHKSAGLNRLAPSSFSGVHTRQHRAGFFKTGGAFLTGEDSTATEPDRG